jgi:hypothetical protein
MVAQYKAGSRLHLQILFRLGTPIPSSIHEYEFLDVLIGRAGAS